MYASRSYGSAANNASNAIRLSASRAVRAKEVIEAVAEIRAAGWPGNEITRFVLFGVHDDGYLTQVELALDPD